MCSQPSGIEFFAHWQVNSRVVLREGAPLSLRVSESREKRKKKRVASSSSLDLHKGGVVVPGYPHRDPSWSLTRRLPAPGNTSLAVSLSIASSGPASALRIISVGLGVSQERSFSAPPIACS
eukprot:1825943-Rhodomonas_salina.1